jgi:glutamate---cysteine ligase / carboxylate-amine ligase
MLLDPRSLALVPRAQEVLGRLAGDPRFKLELPASQLEITTPAATGVDELGQFLLKARRDLARAADGIARIASAGVHPQSQGLGELNRTPRYERTIQEYGPLAARQLVCALQVHVSVGDADRALAVYNAARSYLPLIAALSANAPYYEGHDTGLASIRPKLAELLPRQGVPPALESWEQYAAALRWGAKVGTVIEPRTWWWELRLHPTFGTLEFRVPDGQSTVAEAVAIASVAQALVAWLDSRSADGDPLQVHPTWRIEENRWSACRHGVQGSMTDLNDGTQLPTREHLDNLLSTLEPTAAALGSATPLSLARKLIARNGAISQREVADKNGVNALTTWLVERFCLDRPG